MRPPFVNLFDGRLPTDNEVTPRLGISMGDPVGVGPEVICQALSVIQSEQDCQCIVFGDAAVLRNHCSADQEVLELEELAQARLVGPRTIQVVSVSELEDFEPGQPNPSTDRAQLDYIHTVVDEIKNQTIDALVTGPIHKEAIRRAGAPWPGHTEMLATLSSDSAESPGRPVMMLAGPSIRTVPVTTHISIKDLPEKLTIEKLEYALVVTVEALRKYFGLAAPKVAVAGLNPHAGEGGLFGREELDIIQPAIQRAQSKLQLEIAGPLPGDTVFRSAAAGQFDAVLGMYHDQALIPVKLLDFDHVVNVTLGLPLIRTSVDHGTAYDIAGRGQASATSMVEAIRLADKMVRCAKTV